MSRNNVRRRFPGFHNLGGDNGGVDAMAADMAAMGTPPGQRRGAAGEANTDEGGRRRAAAAVLD